MPISLSVVAGVVVVLLVVGAVIMYHHHSKTSSGSSAPGSGGSGSSSGGSGSSSGGSKPSLLPPLVYLFNYFIWPSSAPGTLITILNPATGNTNSGTNPLPAAYLGGSVSFSAPSTGFTINAGTQGGAVVLSGTTGVVPMPNGTVTKISGSSSVLYPGTTNNYVHITGVPIITGLKSDTVYFSSDVLATFT